MAQTSKRKKTVTGPTPCCGGLSSYLSPKLFKAMSDPKRLSLFVKLAETKCSCNVGQIAEGSGVDLSVVSRHLGILRDAGVLECMKSGKEVWYSVKVDSVVRILRGLADAIEKCCPDGARENSDVMPFGSFPKRKSKRP